jgi:hypothetical protein
MIVRVIRNDHEAEAWLIKYLEAREERVVTRTRRTFSKTDPTTLSAGTSA